MKHILTRPVFMQCVSTSDSYIQVCYDIFSEDFLSSCAKL